MADHNAAFAQALWRPVPVCGRRRYRGVGRAFSPGNDGLRLAFGAALGS